MTTHFRSRALVAFVFLSTTSVWANAQEAAIWNGWRAEASAPERITAVEDGVRIQADVDEPTLLRAEQPLGDGRISLAWRADAGAELSLRVREGAAHGHRIRLAGGHAPGSIVDLGDDEANDARAMRWHHANIVLRGAVVEVRIDGGEPSMALDPRVLEGGLAIEVTGSGHVDLREPTIERAPSARWETVLDGAQPIDPARWQPIPGGTWQIEDGAVCGFCAKSEPRHGILLSTFEVDDFAARLVYRAVQGNSGFYFRCEPVSGAVGVHGFQAEIDATRDAGMLYETGGRARVQIPSKERVEQAFRSGEWNEMLVVAIGRRVEVYVNGVRMTRLVDDPGRLKGRIGLQLHGGQDMRVEVRSIELLRGGAD